MTLPAELDSPQTLHASDFFVDNKFIVCFYEFSVMKCNSEHHFYTIAYIKRLNKFNQFNLTNFN
jgi:hypothetical protein